MKVRRIKHNTNAEGKRWTGAFAIGWRHYDPADIVFSATRNSVSAARNCVYSPE